jgi:anti-anti-sigma regulatory factor
MFSYEAATGGQDLTIVDPTGRRGVGQPQRDRDIPPTTRSRRRPAPETTHLLGRLLVTAALARVGELTEEPGITPLLNRFITAGTVPAKRGKSMRQQVEDEAGTETGSAVADTPQSPAWGYRESQDGLLGLQVTPGPGRQTTVTVSGTLSCSSAQALLEAVGGLLGNGESAKLRLDLSGVHTADLGGLRMLAAVRVVTLRAGGDVRVTAVSPAMWQLAEQVGCQQTLGL